MFKRIVLIVSFAGVAAAAYHKNADYIFWSFLVSAALFVLFKILFRRDKRNG